MDHPKALAAALALCLGCSSAISALQLAIRQPGERLKAFPEKVWSQYECDRKRLPFLEIEQMDLSPRRLRPGQEFSQRLVYALCPERPSGVVTGELDTRILYRGRTIVQQHTPSYDLKPGRWVVDAFVQLPDDAEGGIYAFEVRFRSRKLNFKKTLSFAVEPPKP